MAKPIQSSSVPRGIPPRVAWNGKVVTMSVVHDGIAPESAAADFLCAAESHDEASFQRLQQHLAQHDIMPDFAGKNGITPLMAACSTGNARAVELLAAHPLVNLSRADKDGWTALHYAAHCGGPECVRALLSHLAPCEAKTRAGETPFALAPDEKTRDAFLENRDVARKMQRLHPDHPVFNPAPSAAPEPPPLSPVPKAPAEADPLRDAFFRAITTVGLQMQTESGARLLKSLVDRMAAMKAEEIPQAWASVRAAGTGFPWEAVFILAANRGNTPVMRFLHDQILFDERTLNQALSAAMSGSDRRDVAHHLMAWGANPMSPYELNGEMKAPTSLDAAFRLRRLDTFEEIMLWKGRELADRDVRKYEDSVRVLTSAAAAKARFALALRRNAKEFRKLRGKALQKTLAGAVAEADLSRIMPAYLEAQRDRFLRGNIDISKETGGGAIAVALINGRFEFARLLISDGHKLSDAPARLRNMLTRYGSEEARAFAKAHEEGRLENIAVRDVGMKKRSEIRVLMSMPYRPHYGMF